MTPHRSIPALLFLGLAAQSFLGCVAPEAGTLRTVSGRPEIVIASRDIDAMKSQLIGEMVHFGYQVDSNSRDLLEISRNATDLITAHAVGSADGPHRRVVIYTFIQQGVSTRIIADVSMRAQLPGGQVDTVSLNDNGTVYGFFQKQLDKLKETLE